MKPDARDIVQITALVHAFFSALDRFEDDRIMDLVVPEVTWVRASGDLRGADAVQAMLRGRPRDRLTRHQTFNIDVGNPTETQARVVFDVAVFEGRPADGPATVRCASLITCEDVVVRTEDGWKFLARTARRLAAVA